MKIMYYATEYEIHLNIEKVHTWKALLISRVVSVCKCTYLFKVLPYNLLPFA